MQILNGYGWRCGFWLVCAAYAALPVWAQEPQQQQTEGAPQLQNGFSIRETSIYSTYYSLGMPTSLTTSALASQAGADVAISASTGFAYARQSERTNMSLLYTPSYSRRVRYTNWSAFNNSLSLQLNRSMTSRLQLLITGSAALRNREELQFNPVPTPSLTGGGTSTGGVTIPELPASGDLSDPAAQSLLFGSRIFTANVRTGFRYMYTPRISLTGGVISSRVQYLRTRRDEALQQQTAVIPQVTSVGGDFSVAYDLSQRTNIGVTFDTSRQQSRLQNALISNARFQVQRILTRHWSVTGYGGTGQIRRLGQQVIDPSGGQLQYIAGGSITFQSYSHTFVASFDRRIADIYGIGASNSSSITGLWQWAKPTSRNRASVSFGRTELQSFSFPATSWRGMIDASRRISGQVSMTASYSYVGYANAMVLQSSLLNQHSVRVGFAWLPGFLP